jgi:RNA polymerase sigma-70 factor (ECF subfamily)
LVLSLTAWLRQTVRMAEDRARLTLTRTTFGALTDPFRRDLLLHCYRFVGSVADAEDLVQETLARAWRGRDGYRGEAGLRTWLRRIATRVCLDELRRGRSRRTLPSDADGSARDEPRWLEPLPDHVLDEGDVDPAAAFELRESVSLAFMVAIHRLPPRQRAVLILRDVLALSAAEVADHLDTTVSSANSLLHRARRTMRAGYAPISVPHPDDPAVGELLRRYLAAWEAGDVDALLATLKADATLEMPPIAAASVGHAAVRAFLAGTILDGTRGRWHGLTIVANGGPAVAIYQREADAYRFIGIQLLTIDADRIGRVTAYMDDGLAATFHLPQQLPNPPAQHRVMGG